MNKGLSIAFLVAGVVLLIFGINATDSFTSSVSKFFTGSPTDKAIWLMLGGIVLGVMGLVGTLRKTA
jgi:uncharacterized membrane protein YidH (DUF202 family)